MYRVRTVFGGVAGSPWYSNLFFDDQDAGGAEGAVQAVADFWEDLRPDIRSGLSWTVEGDVAIISPGTGEMEGVFPVGAVTGSGMGPEELLPTATQGLLRLRTGAYVGGREVRGRVNVPGLTEAASSSGVPIPTFIGRLSSAGANLVDHPDATLMVYSRKNFIASPVVSATAAPYWAVLRSRRD